MLYTHTGVLQSKQKYGTDVVTTAPLPFAPLASQLPANATARAEKDGPRAWETSMGSAFRLWLTQFWSWSLSGE